MTFILHVIVEVAVLYACAALVLTPDHLQGTVALVCLETQKGGKNKNSPSLPKFTGMIVRGRFVNRTQVGQCCF